MVAGHLQEKKGLFYIVLNCKDEEGKRKPKWIPTGLTVKGNKKRAEALLLETRREFTLLLNATEKEPIVEEIIEEMPAEEPFDQGPLFSVFMLQWLAMMKHQVEFITYASYHNVITNHIVPYFEEKGLFLKELLPSHIQDYYQYELEENGVTTNTVLHYHANIRKALKHALKNDLINTNPADKIERPKKNDFVGSFYNKQETNILFEKVKGELIELAVILAAFYGLRRSEVVGLKWTAINFENKTISIRHTVTPVYFEGQEHIIEKDRAKNKPSRRTLPLVPAFEELLLRIRELQALNKAICGKSYCTDYEEYIYLDKLGQRIKPGYITQNFTRTLKKNGLRHIRYHDLRHSCASLLLANGVSMKEIQEWLGHSNYSTTANLFSLGIQFQSIFSINNEWCFGLLIKKIALPSILHESHAIFSSFSPPEKGENCRRELDKKFSPKLFQKPRFFGKTLINQGCRGRGSNPYGTHVPQDFKSQKSFGL